MGRSGNETFLLGWSRDSSNVIPLELKTHEYGEASHLPLDFEEFISERSTLQPIQHPLTGKARFL